MDPFVFAIGWVLWNFIWFQDETFYFCVNLRCLRSLVKLMRLIRRPSSHHITSHYQSIHLFGMVDLDDRPSSNYSCDFDFMHLTFRDWIHPNDFHPSTSIERVKCTKQKLGAYKPIRKFLTPESVPTFPTLNQFERQWNEEVPPLNQNVFFFAQHELLRITSRVYSGVCSLCNLIDAMWHRLLLHKQFFVYHFSLPLFMWSQQKP